MLKHRQTGTSFIFFSFPPRRKKSTKDVKPGKLKDGELAPGQTEEPVRDPAKEAELLLMQRFRTFEHLQNDLCYLLEFWDRTSLQVKRPITPSEKSDEDGAQHPPSGKKGKGKGEGSLWVGRCRKISVLWISEDTGLVSL